MAKKGAYAKLKTNTKDNLDNKDKFVGGGSHTLNLPEGTKFVETKKGTNRWKIIPYLIGSENHPLVVEGRREVGDPDYVLDIWVHRFIGPDNNNFVCPKMNYHQRCPICEEVDRLKAIMDEAGDKNIQDKIDSIKAKRRVIYNVVNLNSEELNVQIFEASHYKFEKPLLEEAASDESLEVVCFSDPDENWVLKLRGAAGTHGGRKFIEFTKFDFEEDDEDFDDDWLDEAYVLDSLLNIPDYETIKEGFYGPDEYEGGEAEVGEEAPKKRSRKKKVVDEEPEEVEEEEAPKKRGRKKKEVKEEVGEDDLCPHGFVPETDCDEHEECDDCEYWDDCIERKKEK